MKSMIFLKGLKESFISFSYGLVFFTLWLVTFNFPSNVSSLFFIFIDYFSVIGLDYSYFLFYLQFFYKFCGIWLICGPFVISIYLSYKRYNFIEELFSILLYSLLSLWLSLFFLSFCYNYFHNWTKYGDVLVNFLHLFYLSGLSVGNINTNITTQQIIVTFLQDFIKSVVFLSTTSNISWGYHSSLYYGSVLNLYELTFKFVKNFIQWQLELNNTNSTSFIMANLGFVAFMGALLKNAPYSLILGKVSQQYIELDSLSLLFAGLSVFIITLVILLVFSSALVEIRIKFYFILLFILLGLLNVVFLTVNLIVFFIAFECILIPIIFLIGLWGSPNKRQANFYLVFYTSLGAIPFMLGIFYLLAKFNYNMLQLSQLFLIFINFTTTEQLWLWLVFFFSFAIKTPIVPFHIWLPKAHVDAPTVGSVILAALLLKIGLYGVLRFLLPIFPIASYFYAPYVAAFSTLGVLYSSFITLWQIDIKRIIAYSSIAHINLAIVSFFSLTPTGLAAAIFIIISHAFISGALFFLVGFLYSRFHQRTIFYYGGLVTIIPIFSLYFFVFLLANIAFPLTAGFIGEFLCLLGIFTTNWVLGLLNSMSIFFTTGYSILLFSRICFDRPKLWLNSLINLLINQKRELFVVPNIKNFNVLDNVTAVFFDLTVDLKNIELLILNCLISCVIIFGIQPNGILNVCYHIIDTIPLPINIAVGLN